MQRGVLERIEVGRGGLRELLAVGSNVRLRSSLAYCPHGQVVGAGTTELAPDSAEDCVSASGAPGPREVSAAADQRVQRAPSRGHD